MKTYVYFLSITLDHFVWRCTRLNQKKTNKKTQVNHFLELRKPICSVNGVVYLNENIGISDMRIEISHFNYIRHWLLSVLFDHCIKFIAQWLFGNKFWNERRIFDPISELYWIQLPTEIDSIGKCKIYNILVLVKLTNFNIIRCCCIYARNASSNIMWRAFADGKKWASVLHISTTWRTQ